MSHSNTKATGLTLAGLIVAVSMTTIDQTIVALSAPTIETDLGLGHDVTQWAVNVYLIATAAEVPTPVLVHTAQTPSPYTRRTHGSPSAETTSEDTRWNPFGRNRGSTGTNARVAAEVVVNGTAPGVYCGSNHSTS